MIRRPSKFHREIAAQMLVGFCTESTKGTCQDTPPLPPTTSLQEYVPVPPTITWEIRGLINHSWRKASACFKKSVPDYTVGIPWVINWRKRWTHPQPTGGPEHPWTFKKTRPCSQGIRGSTTIVASTQHIKCGKAPSGQSALKISSRSVWWMKRLISTDFTDFRKKSGFCPKMTNIH
jgi:hypothetical protein